MPADRSTRNPLCRAVRIIGPWRVAASLACGVLATVAVAWWFALARPSLGFPASLEHPFETWVVAEGLRLDGREREHWIEHRRSPGVRRLTYTTAPDRRDAGDSTWTPHDARFRRLRERLAEWVNAPGTNETSTAHSADPTKALTAAPPSQTDGRPRVMLRSLSIDAAGWPLAALESEKFQIISADPTIAREEFSGRWLVSKGVKGSPETPLPIRPRPLGMLVDVLVYAAPVYVVLSIVPVVRGVHRRLGDRCRACGYSLDGLAAPACPECGAATRRGPGGSTPRCAHRED